MPADRVGSARAALDGARAGGAPGSRLRRSRRVRAATIEASGTGRLTAGEVGALAGVSGTTVGQWARHGLIRASQSSAVPHVYSVEDAAEAALVAALLARGVRHAEVRRTVARLEDGYGPWPLAGARLATSGRQVLLREDADVLALGARGWQAVAVPPLLEDVHLRLRRG